MKTIYVGIALTNAPESFRTTFYDELKEGLEALNGVKVLEFIGLKEGQPRDVHEYDRECLEGADLMIGICDHPSTGLGMEIVYRHNTRKPLLLFAHKDATVTRMVVGFSQKEHIPCIKYKAVSDIVSCVKSELAAL